MFHTPHSMQPRFRWMVGLMVVAALAASSIAFVAVDGRSLIFSSLRPNVIAPAPAVATTNDSALPQGLTDHPAPRAAAARFLLGPVTDPSEQAPSSGTPPAADSSSGPSPTRRTSAGADPETGDLRR